MMSHRLFSLISGLILIGFGITNAQALAVSPHAISLVAGKTAQVQISDIAGTLTVSSNNTSIASVVYRAGSATITGVKAGIATVTIQDQEESQQVNVTVSKPVTPNMTVSSNAITLAANATASVQVINAAGSVTVSSTNTGIATASFANGMLSIQGKKAGTATLTLSDGHTTLKITVSVTSVTVAVLSVTPASLTVNVGAIANLTVTNPNGAVSVQSANTSIATVSYASGKVVVTGVKAGTVNVTVHDSKTIVVVAVTVNSPVVPALTVSPATIAVTAGASAKINISNANGTVSVVSANASIASVSYANGLATVVGVKAGSTKMTIQDSKNSAVVTVTVLAAPQPAANANYTLLAWNDLGMHCLDGTDYSVFAILPPYNTLHAQLKNKAGSLVTSNVVLTYEAMADSSGSINTSSANKTNFWSWALDLFGASPAPNVGLNLDGLASGNPLPGNKAPSLTPAAMSFNSAYNWFEAEGIPITPIDDNGHKNYYPMVKVVAKDAITGATLATTTTTLPVSDEMTCVGCHASTHTPNQAQLPTKPTPDYVFDNNPLKDWKRNILLLHDQKQAADSTFQAALVQAGYPKGLLASADAGKPVLCVSCHASNAYFDKENKKSVMGGLTINGKTIPAFTQALHNKHADVLDPVSLVALDSTDNRSACYNCHPGSVTQCLRGPMGNAKDAKGNQAMSCQSCHGTLKQVASPARQGWYNEPTCESCHNSAAPGHRALSGVDANGLSIIPTDHTFAANSNTPAPGLDLYRFSTGHGGLQCEACHGSTHAEYPSTHADENLQSIAVQGHVGPVAECTACHSTIPNTVNGGPHGMHTTGQAWVSQHQEANKNGTATTPACSYCHGTTSAGTPLSTVKVAKTLNAGEYGTKSFAVGDRVSCYSCHNGPNP